MKVANGFQYAMINTNCFKRKIISFIYKALVVYTSSATGVVYEPNKYFCN